MLGNMTFWFNLDCKLKLATEVRVSTWPLSLLLFPSVSVVETVLWIDFHGPGAKCMKGKSECCDPLSYEDQSRKENLPNTHLFLALSIPDLDLAVTGAHSQEVAVSTPRQR